MIWNKSKQPADPQQDAAAAPKKGGATAFAQKNWKWLVPVAIVVLAGGWWLLKPKGAKPANVDTSYTEAVPETRDVSNTLSGTGTLKPANTYSVKSLVPGKVLTGGFEEGDIVEEGTVLYTVDSSDATTKVEQAAITLQQAQRSYDKTADHQYVRAEVAGVVSSLKVNKGDEVKSGQEVAVVRDSSKMNLVLEFPAADAANFSAGQTAQVTLDGTFEVLPGTITAVTGTDALSTGNPHCDPLGVQCGWSDHGTGCNGYYQRGELHCSSQLPVSGRAYPDCAGFRYRHRHQCAGGRQREQGRYHPDPQR